MAQYNVLLPTLVLPAAAGCTVGNSLPSELPPEEQFDPRATFRYDTFDDHNGAFAALADVIDHYDLVLHPGLPDSEKAGLREYPKSL